MHSLFYSLFRTAFLDLSYLLKLAYPALKYVINAMKLLINEMTALGTVRSRLIAKVFGGGKERQG